VRRLHCLGLRTAYERENGTSTEIDRLDGNRITHSIDETSIAHLNQNDIEDTLVLVCGYGYWTMRIMQTAEIRCPWMTDRTASTLEGMPDFLNGITIQKALVQFN
jgi:hypothetical protein